MIILLALSWSKIQISHRWWWVVVQSTGDPAKRITTELFCLSVYSLYPTKNGSFRKPGSCLLCSSVSDVCFYSKKKKTWQNFVFEKWAMFPHVGRATELDEDAQKTDNCFCVIILVTRWPHHYKLVKLFLWGVLFQALENEGDFIQPRARLCAFYCQVVDNGKAW